MNPTVADRIKARLEEFTGDLENGKIIREKYTCRMVEFKLKPKQYSPHAIKKTRNLLQASQQLFALFLGTSVKTIQAWEQGICAPSKMACRFMDEIRRNPEYWQRRLSESLVLK